MRLPPRKPRVGSTRLSLAITMAIGCVAPALPSRTLYGQVTTAQYDNARTGANTRETKLTPRSVAAASFGKVAAMKVDGDVYAQVLYLPTVTVPGKGTHPVVFVATEHNSIYAFDAERAGEPLWHVNLSNVASGAEPVLARDVSCPFIRPEVGITATPVIDTTTNTIFVLARTKEGGRSVQRLHSLDVRNGEPKHPAVEIAATARGKGAGSVNGVIAFDPLRENPRAALLLVNGRVILAWASSCDVGPYHGWVMAYDARTLRQVAALNTTPDGADGGIWQGDAGLAADERGRIYAITGNGTFDASSTAGRDFGDTVLQLTLQDGRFDVSDFFTPFNQLRLQQGDGDLGSGGPLLIPAQPGSHRRLLFFGGKGGGVYLLDRDRLGHFSPDSDGAAVQTMKASGMVMGASAYWNRRVYSLWSEDVVRMFDVVDDHLALRATSASAHRFRDPGATPTVSANGRTDGIVWLIESKTWNGSDRPAVLHAYDGTDLRELYSSEMNAKRDRAALTVRFAIPTVAAGRVYVGTKGQIDVYGILSENR